MANSRFCWGDENLGLWILVAFERANVNDELQGEVVSGAPNITSSKYIRHARVMKLYLEVVTTTVKDF